MVEAVPPPQEEQNAAANITALGQTSRITLRWPVRGLLKLNQKRIQCGKERHAVPGIHLSRDPQRLRLCWQTRALIRRHDNRSDRGMCSIQRHGRWRHCAGWGQPGHPSASVGRYGDREGR